MSEPRTLAHEVAEVLREDEIALRRRQVDRLRLAHFTHLARREGQSDHPPFEQVERDNSQSQQP